MMGFVRVLAVAGIFVLALCGCQKGNSRAGAGSPDGTGAAKADSKSGHATMKSRSMTEGKGAKAAPAKKATQSHEVAHKAGSLTAADNEREFDFRQGQTITVVLDSNRASGLSWVLVQPSGTVIVPSGSAMYSVRAGKNAGGSETWHFRAAKPGYQTVKMEYRRKWAQSVPERTFRFSGTVR